MEMTNLNRGSPLYGSIDKNPIHSWISTPQTINPWKPWQERNQAKVNDKKKLKKKEKTKKNKK